MCKLYWIDWLEIFNFEKDESNRKREERDRGKRDREEKSFIDHSTPHFSKLHNTMMVMWLSSCMKMRWKAMITVYK